MVLVEENSQARRGGQGDFIQGFQGAESLAKRIPQIGGIERLPHLHGAVPDKAAIRRPLHSDQINLLTANPTDPGYRSAELAKPKGCGRARMDSEEGRAK